jgi:hypothetical protein
MAIETTTMKLNHGDPRSLMPEEPVMDLNLRLAKLTLDAAIWGEFSPLVQLAAMIGRSQGQLANVLRGRRPGPLTPNFELNSKIQTSVGTSKR